MQKSGNQKIPYFRTVTG